MSEISGERFYVDTAIDGWPIRVKQLGNDDVLEKKQILAALNYMDSELSKAEKASQELQEKQQEINELKAYVELLKVAVSANESVSIASTEYISRIKAQVEEETIEWCVEQIRNKGDSSSYDMVQDALEYIADLLEAQPRKYKEQSDETL